MPTLHSDKAAPDVVMETLSHDSRMDVPNDETDEQAAARLGPGHAIINPADNTVRATDDVLTIARLRRDARKWKFAVLVLLVGLVLVSARFAWFVWAHQ